MSSVPRYPRTLHLPFSMEVHKDDKVIRDCSNFINREVVITEKLDGGNCCFHDGKTYARSTTQETKCETFHFVKRAIAWKTKDIKHHFFYGENLYAKHSISYNKLESFFNLFAVRDSELWLSWSEVEHLSEMVFECPTVPVLFRGIFKSIQEIENWMYKEIKKPSAYGEEREGFVIKVTHRYPIEDHSSCVAKFVRKGHVQTDEHWSKSWQPNKLI